MLAPILCACAALCVTRCSGLGDEVVDLDRDFNKLQADPELAKHVSEALYRLQSFEIPVHPRERIYFELLKLHMNQYAQRTADSLYIPDKYNVAKSSGCDNSQKTSDSFEQYMVNQAKDKTPRPLGAPNSPSETKAGTKAGTKTGTKA